MKADSELEVIRERVEEFTAATGRPPRLLVAKLGQDGHDRGQKVMPRPSPTSASMSP